MNTLIDFQNELMHYGVKGMHWGIRRYQPYPDEHRGGKFIGRIKANRIIKKINYNEKKLANAKRFEKDSKLRESKFKKKNKMEKSLREKEDVKKLKELQISYKKENDKMRKALKDSGYKVGVDSINFQTKEMIPIYQKYLISAAYGPFGKTVLDNKFGRKFDYDHHMIIKVIDKAKKKVKDVKV